MTQHFNARGRENHINLRRAMRTIGGIGWYRVGNMWRHPKTGLSRHIG